MSGKPVLPRELANRDVEAAVDYYAHEAGARTALGFIDALQSAYKAIADHPALGSPRHARELSLPELRSRALKGVPYLIFYVERENQIDVWRVLHSHRDIPSRMRD